MDVRARLANGQRDRRHAGKRTGRTIFDIIRDAAVDLEYPCAGFSARQRSLEDVYIQTVAASEDGSRARMAAPSGG